MANYAARCVHLTRHASSPRPAQLPDRLLNQLDTDRRHRYASSSPMPKLYTWWMQRLTATLVLTAALPVVCWWLKEFEKAHSHHGHGDEHGGGHGHGEPHEAVDAHGTAAHGDEHSTAAHAEPSHAATHHRALAVQPRRSALECHDDPTWTSPDGKLKCVDYEGERRQASLLCTPFCMFHHLPGQRRCGV
jgi:hypothetical protein